MAKTIVKKTKHGIYFKGPGYEFVKNKQGFHAAEECELGELVVTPDEAKTIIKEHALQHDKQLEALKAKIKELEEKVCELEDYEWLDCTASGHDVRHDGSSIKIGCNTIPFALAKKLV